MARCSNGKRSRLQPETAWSRIHIPVLLLSGLAAVPVSASAQTTCIPLGIGVPALIGPPTWWDADGDLDFPEIPNDDPTPNLPEELERFADPRWRGAVSHTDGFTSAEHVDFRAVFAGESVYLSWQVLMDPGGLDVNADALWFGIKSATQNAVVFKLSVNTSSTVALKAEPQPGVLTEPYTVQMLLHNGTIYQAVPPSSAPWLASMARIWTQWDGEPYSAWWAFQVVIPKSAAGLSDGLNIDTTFDMWYTFFVTLEGPVAQYHWPRERYIDLDNDGSPDGDILEDGGNIPDPTNAPFWGEFTLGTAPEGQTCAGDVALASNQIGTTNSPSSKIEYTQPPSSNTKSNTFFARPKNIRELGSQSILPGEITAKFYLANWGSLADWNNLGPGGDITTLWREITVGTPANTDSIDPQKTADASNDIRSVWPPLSDCEVYDYIPNLDPPASMGCPPGTERRPHQCVLVELSSTTQMTFRNKSAYRNMDFVAASTFSRDAEISVVGLAPIPDTGPRRDVYLYVQTINMPAQVASNHSGPDRRHGIAGVGLPDTLSSEQIDSLSPTYRVHAYHATGDSVILGGVKRPIVHAQTSFGYWLTHEGELQGWRHRIDGANLIQLSPNFYKLSVPNNGVAVVTSTIQAIEPARLAVSLHGGVGIPHGSFGNALDLGFVVTADLGIRLTPALWLEGMFGYNRFQGTAGASDQKVYQATGGVRVYPSHGAVRPFLGAGGGTYVFDPGSTNAGVYGGGGIQINVSRTLALEASYYVHHAFTSNASTTFSNIQSGLRFRF